MISWFRLLWWLPTFWRLTLTKFLMGVIRIGRMIFTSIPARCLKWSWIPRICLVLFGIFCWLSYIYIWLFLLSSTFLMIDCFLCLKRSKIWLKIDIKISKTIIRKFDAICSAVNPIATYPKIILQNGSMPLTF